MNILIVATYFPPDTAIASVRPYMFAKYLVKLGHSVTVLRSGELSRSADYSFESRPKNLRVISYLGDGSPAEAFERGEIEAPSYTGTSRISFLPRCIRLPIGSAYHYIIKPVELFRTFQKAKFYFKQQKIALHQLQNESFDIIFATYGRLENIYAGKYAADLFKCKWILDLRDSIPQKLTDAFWENSILKIFQDRAIRSADICTIVSDGLRESSKEAMKGNVITLYNGYDIDNLKEGLCPLQEVLSFCYTGQLYGGTRTITPLLEALSQLNGNGQISLERIQIHYAGPDFEYLQMQAHKLNLEKILINHGYVDRLESSKIQKKSDIFLTLAQNTKNYKGDLSGKFYEGIRCGHPILSIVSGNAPYSELFTLNEQYKYGFCYETCRKKNTFQEFCGYLVTMYNQKMKYGYIPYFPSPELYSRFRYDTLTKQLEKICFNLSVRGIP